MLSQDSTLHISLLAQTKAWGITDFSLAAFQQNYRMLKGNASAPLPQKYIAKGFQYQCNKKGSSIIHADKML